MLFGFFAISSGVPSATIPIRFLYQAYIYIYIYIHSFYRRND